VQLGNSAPDQKKKIVSSLNYLSNRLIFLNFFEKGKVKASLIDTIITLGEEKLRKIIDKMIQDHSYSVKSGKIASILLKGEYLNKSRQ